ncbi:MAG: F0F1 ATP synthase subunit delta, partial [Clostridia bacterium]|nr:F0F1 ATP synthase subunit delta [Clostridia bacterium]
MADFVVTSAKALSDAKKREIISRLGAKEGEVTFLIDEALIGGLVISDGETVLDASVREKLRLARRNASSTLANQPLEHILSSLKEEFSHTDKAKPVTAGIVRSISDGVIFAEGLDSAK